MSRIRTTKSQSRPAPAVARVGGSPVVRRTTNGSAGLKIYEKPKTRRNSPKQIIRFKEYYDLVDRSLEKSAKKINDVLDPDYEKENERKLKKYALKDFLKYSKNHYFKKEGFFWVSQDGYLGIDWHLTNNFTVNIIFFGKKKVELYLGSINRSIIKKTTLDSINEILNHFNAPVQ